MDVEVTISIKKLWHVKLHPPSHLTSNLTDKNNSYNNTCQIFKHL